MGRGACRDGQELTFTDATGWQACNESLHQFMSKALLLPLRVTEAKVSQRQQASREDVNSDLCDFKAHNFFVVSYTCAFFHLFYSSIFKPLIYWFIEFILLISG